MTICYLLRKHYRLTMKQKLYCVIFAVLAQPCFATEQNFHQKINQYAKKVITGAEKGVTSFIVIKNNQRLVSSYAPNYTNDTQHDLRSVTKSITALLLGQAIQEQLIADEQSAIKSLLPSTAFTTSPAIQNLSIIDLLTMRTGLACDDWVPSSLGNEDKMYLQNNWPKFFLALPASHEKGKHFSYCTGAAIVIGHILNNKLNGNLAQWVDQRLFSKLNVTDYKWTKTPYGEIDTGGHLYMKAEDLAKFGQLVLNQGRYNNQQVIAKSWIDKLFTAQTKVYERPYFYSYWWWLSSDNTANNRKQKPYLFAWGNGGQYLFIIPEHKLVMVFTGTNFNSKEMLKPQRKVKEWLDSL